MLVETIFTCPNYLGKNVGETLVVPRQALGGNLSRFVALVGRVAIMIGCRDALLLDGRTAGTLVNGGAVTGPLRKASTGRSPSDWRSLLEWQAGTLLTNKQHPGLAARHMNFSTSRGHFVRINLTYSSPPTARHLSRLSL